MQCDVEWQDRKLAHPRRYKTSYILEFPAEDIAKVNFSSSDQITKYLRKQALKIGYFQDELFQKKTLTSNNNENSCFVYSCTVETCKAVLEYFKSRGALKLVRFNNLHNHKLKITPKRAKHDEIRQLLLNMPIQENIDSHIAAVKTKFNLNKQQAKYLKTTLFWKFDNDDDLLEKLSEKNIMFRRDVDRGVLLIVTQSMRSNYLLYGDHLCFDVTYKLLKKKKNEDRHLGVAFFVGQDENTRLLLFGMATIRLETSENFKLLFSFFFDCVGNKIPQTILTDDQRALVNAIEQLKTDNDYQYVHLLDWYHKIENIRKKVRRQPNRNALFQLFIRLLKEPSRIVFNQIVLQLASFITREQIILSFLKESQKYCLSQIPCSFIGFGVSSSRAESMNNLIKSYVTHQTKLSKLVYFVVRVQKKLIENARPLCFTNQSILITVKNKEMLLLNSYLEYQTYDKIRECYEQSKQLSVTLIDSVTVEVPYIKYDRSYSFKLKFDMESNCWRCECKGIYKTGIPCSHLIRTVLTFGGCIGYYINERWIHCKQNSDKVKVCRPYANKNKMRS